MKKQRIRHEAKDYLSSKKLYLKLELMDGSFDLFKSEEEKRLFESGEKFIDIIESIEKHEQIIYLMEDYAYFNTFEVIDSLKLQLRIANNKLLQYKKKKKIITDCEYYDWSGRLKAIWSKYLSS